MMFTLAMIYDYARTGCDLLTPLSIFRLLTMEYARFQGCKRFLICLKTLSYIFCLVSK